MPFGTTKNTTLEKIRVKPGKNTLRSATGEAAYVEYDLEVVLSPFVLDTWVDWSVSRQVRVNKENINVRAVWEVKDWIQTQISGLIGRSLRVGDIVKFTTSSNWFSLQDREHESGLFESDSTEKFDLVNSRKVRIV